MKIAISGAKGFVGNNLIHQLDKYFGYEILPLDIQDGFDLMSSEQCKSVEPFDIFIHLANKSFIPASYNNPEEFYRINYMTTLNSLELCRKYKASFIYVSSYVYGMPEYLPVDENHPVKPFNPYAQSKVICESLCEGYFRDFNIPIVILRPFNIYGINQQGSLLIPEIINQLKVGKSIITLNDSVPQRDFVNVKDVSNAIIKCLDIRSPTYRIYNLCSGVSYSVLEITNIINNNLIKPVEFNFLNNTRPSEVNEVLGSYHRIAVDISWKPEIVFEDGILEILKYENL